VPAGSHHALVEEVEVEGFVPDSANLIVAAVTHRAAERMIRW
jgi:hypothetical protein